MKTNNLIVAIVILFSMASCQTSYRMVSRIKTDGSLYREVYAYGDSAFLAGDRAENPFLFQIDSDTWQLVGLGSSIKFNFWGNEQELNVKVCRDIPGMSGEYFEVSDTKEYAAPLAVPQEILEKKFRWFYTYYSYKAIYSELPDKGPVPLDRYFSDEERQIWFRGDENAFAGWNGIELNNRLDDIENKFVVEESDKDLYETKITYNGQGLDNEEQTYIIYYKETIVNDDDKGKDKDEVETTLEGIAIVDGQEYKVFGEKEVEKDELEIELEIIFDKDNYVKISQEKENNKTEYEYEVVKNGRTVNEFEMEFKQKNGKMVIEIEKEMVRKKKLK